MKIVSLSAAALVVGMSGAVAEELRIGSSADYPPWESVDASGEIVGFDRDMGDEICARINVTCTWANQAYDGLLPSLQVGKYDLLISGMSINAERAQMVDFSLAYADAPNAFVAPSTNALSDASDKAALIAALAGKVVGVQSGTTHEQVLTAHFPEVDVRSYERPDQVADDLRSGRIDAGLMEVSAWAPFLEGGESSGLKRIGPQLSGADYPEFGQGQGIAMKKDSAELKGKIDAAITAMLADGTMANLSQKWFGYDISSKH